MAIGISIIICTYNSATRITQTLNHLAKQVLPPSLSCEINLIDNASTDGTASKALLFWNSTAKDITLNIYDEPKSGKSFALDTGIKNSNYDFIIICDDDNWLHENYVADAFKIMSEDKKIGALGGQGIAVADQELPSWFKEYENGYAVGKQADKSGDITQKMYVWGAGMIFRKELYKKVYYKFPSVLTGPKLNTVSRGEDVEFCMRIIMCGYKLYYEDLLKYAHYMPAERLTISYRNKLFEGYEIERYVLNLYKRQMKISKSNLIWVTKLFCASLFRYLFCIIFVNQKWNRDFEAETIYLLTGIKLKSLTEEVVRVRALQKYLTAN